MVYRSIVGYGNVDITKKMKEINENFVIPRKIEDRRKCGEQIAEIIERSQCITRCRDCAFNNKNRWRNGYSMSCSSKVGFHISERGNSISELRLAWIDWAKSGFKGEIKLKDLEFEF